MKLTKKDYILGGSVIGLAVIYLIWRKPINELLGIGNIGGKRLVREIEPITNQKKKTFNT